MVLNRASPVLAYLSERRQVVAQRSGHVARCGRFPATERVARGRQTGGDPEDVQQPVGFQRQEDCWSRSIASLNGPSSSRTSSSGNGLTAIATLSATTGGGGLRGMDGDPDCTRARTAASISGWVEGTDRLYRRRGRIAGLFYVGGDGGRALPVTGHARARAARIVTTGKNSIV